MENEQKARGKEGVSIVIPFLNEAEGIQLCCKTMDDRIATLSFPVELVFVDDGSTDESVLLLKQYTFQNVHNVKLVKLSKNYGSHAAIRAGIQNSSFDICTWLGSDLQEPFELIPMSYELICQGYDAVYVDKKTVNVSRGNRLFSKVYSRLMQKYAVKEYSSGGTSVIVFNGKIKKYLNENVESNSSIMLQIMDAGFHHTTISLDFAERSAGVSKWTLSKKLKLFIDSFVAFSFMPIRLVSIVGILMFFLGILLGIGTIINRFLNPSVPVGYSTLVSIIAVGFGITNISLGIIAEYLWRTYDAARKRPAFIVAEVGNLNCTDEDRIDTTRVSDQI